MDLIVDTVLRLFDIHTLEEETLPLTLCDEPISKIMYVRYPVKLVKVLNQLSDGRLDKWIHRYGYQQLSSVYIILNDMYVIDKGFRPRIRRLTRRSFRDTTEIPVPSGTTICDFVKKTREYMGEPMFRNYSFTTNNCQDFTWACLVANKFTETVKKTDIKQDSIDSIVEDWLNEWLSDIILSILSINISLCVPFTY